MGSSLFQNVFLFFKRFFASAQLKLTIRGDPNTHKIAKKPMLVHFHKPDWTLEKNN